MESPSAVIILFDIFLMTLYGRVSCASRARAATNQLTNQPSMLSTDHQPTDQPTNQVTNQPINEPTNFPTIYRTNKATQLTNKPTTN